MDDYEDPDRSQLVDVSQTADSSLSPDMSFGPSPAQLAPRMLAGIVVLAVGVSVAVGVFRPESRPHSGFPPPTEAPPPVPTVPAGPPGIRVSLSVVASERATSYLDEFVHFTVSVETAAPADLNVPGPPFLRLRFFEASTGEVLEPRPNPLRPPPRNKFPVSIEAGEGLKLGPMPVRFFDVDPLLFRPKETYRVELTYDPGAGLPVEITTTTAVIVARGDLMMPEEMMPGSHGPLVRAPVPLEILDPSGRMRRYLEWSPDTGFTSSE